MPQKLSKIESEPVQEYHPFLTLKLKIAVKFKLTHDYYIEKLQDMSKTIPNLFLQNTT